MKKLLVLFFSILGLMAHARGESAPLPFDATTANSEQLGFSAISPQIISAATPQSLTMAWQLHDANRSVSSRLTHFTRTGGLLKQAWEKTLPLPRLVGMTSDGSNFYAVSAVLEDMSQDTNPNVFRSRVLIMTKFDSQGNQVWERDLNRAQYLGDASRAIYSPLTAGTGAVVYGAGKVVVALASNTGPDGNKLRHQQAQYFIVGADGSGYGAASETSWRHSFDQRLLFDGQDFIFMDIGDAGWYMPAAGIAVRKIRPTASGADFIGDQENKEGVYIYARQADTESGQVFAFTSLGDLAPGTQGYLALFTSEKGNPSAVRDGWTKPVAEPRNLGFVHVTRNFETVKEGSWNGSPTLGNTIIQDEPIRINITRSVVDSPGPSHSFPHPNKPGKSFTQTGIIWLTNLPSGVSAERSRIVKVSNDRYIVLWEEWTYRGAELRYQATQGIVMSEQGQIVKGPIPLKARLNPSGADRPFEMDGKAAWITSEGQTGQFILYSIDPNLTLSATSLASGSSSQPTVYQDHMSAGDTLKPGDKLQSKNGQYTLVYQKDGNLVLSAPDSRILWSSGTNGQPAGYANMQTDGNFAMYGPDGRFQWNTGTTTPGSRLVLRDDGNLVIVTAAGQTLWATNTASSRNRLNAGEKLVPGDKLQSSNGRYQLIYQTDGNLVLYTAESRALWASGTNGQPAGYVLMQTDGNFAMYGPDGRFQWNTGTTTPGSWIMLHDDGRLVVYTASGVALWTVGQSG